jgi:hypothetical protein
VVHPRPAAGSCELFVNNSRAVTGREEAYEHTFSVVCNHWEVSEPAPSSHITDL